MREGVRSAERRLIVGMGAAKICPRKIGLNREGMDKAGTA